MIPTIAQRIKARLLAATATPSLLFLVGDGLVLLPVLLEVLSLEDDDVADEEDEDDEDGSFDDDDVACSLALLTTVEFAVEFAPGMVMFAMGPVPMVEFVPEPVVVVELPDVPAVPVELLLPVLDPDVTGATSPFLEPEEAVGECEEAVVAVPVPGEVFEAEVAVELEAKAAIASVGQVEHPPNSWSMPE